MTDAFRLKVEAALERVRQILGTTRCPQTPSNVPHRYDDKYGLAEILTNTASASLLHCLEVLGLTQAHFATIFKWRSANQTLTLRFVEEESHTFLRQETREQESPQKRVNNTTTTVTSSSDASTTTASVQSFEWLTTSITEYFWEIRWNWQICIYGGVDINDSNNFIRLCGRQSKYELMTPTQTLPHPLHIRPPPLDIDITFLFTYINSNHQLVFRINRDINTCKTPRRNQDIDNSFEFCDRLQNWCTQVHGSITPIFQSQRDHGYDVTSFDDTSSLFVPVLPLFEIVKPESSLSSSSSSAAPMDVMSSSNSSGVCLRLEDLHKFLNEEKRSIADKLGQLSMIVPHVDIASDVLISIEEVKVIVLILHMREIVFMYMNGVNYIENMLRDQLIAAIGKEVNALDFSNYMNFHYHKIYKAEHAPKPFCYAIRRPDHYPEGTLSIENMVSFSSGLQGKWEPINTCAKSTYTGVHTMHFNINSATRVQFTGERHLHAYIGESFFGDSQLSMVLRARARQYSSFMMIVGRISGPTTFEPKSAIIVQNKDDLTIPLMLDTLPTPKEFKDAISSLSPEQRRFAQAYRSMQLEGTVFAILIIQLKPQLEKLLNLPDDSLTKEIKLTQELLELFMKYQIPSDLVTYSGDLTASKDSKLNAVKEYVRKMYDMIDQCKTKVLDDAAATAHNRMYGNSFGFGGSTFGAPQNGGFGFAPSSSSIPSVPLFGSSAVSPANVFTASERSAVNANGGSGTSSFTLPSIFGTSRLPGAAPAPTSNPFCVDLLTSSSPPSSSSSSLFGSTGQCTESIPSDQRDGAATAAIQQQYAKGKDERLSSASTSEGDGNVIDYTRIPGKLDHQFEVLDVDSALRATTITTGSVWKRSSQANILAETKTENLSSHQQKEEHDKALDLLDALSRSGALSIECASLHVVLAATHSFNQSVMNTIIRDNVNPIEKLERSSLIVATTIHALTAKELLLSDQHQRVSSCWPNLFLQ